MKALLIKLGIKVLSDPKTRNKIIGFLIGLVCVFCMIGIFALNMIGTLVEQDDGTGTEIDSDYDITKTELYKNIKPVYDSFIEEIKEEFEERKKEIIAENTYAVETIVIVDGKKKKVTEYKCDVTVNIDISSFSLSYILSYINHTENVKDGIKYKVKPKQIKDFFKNITEKKELIEGKVYTLQLVTMSVEDVAKLYYSDKQTQEMYIQSFELYEEFIGWLADNGIGGDTAFDGKISLDNITDSQIKADIAAGKYTAEDFGYMYATIIGECASSNEGACAVGWCILNRVDNSKFPNSVRGVCTAAGQFAGYRPQLVNGPYTNAIVKNAAAAVLKRTAQNPVGDYCFFFGRVNGYDLWYEYTKGPKPINVGGNVFHAGGGYVHNKQNKKTSDAVIIWSASEGKWK